MSEWISPDDRLPEHQQRYLVTIKTHKGKVVRSGTYFCELFMNDNGDIWKSTDKEVTAWMPLPEPYKRGKEIK